MIDEWKNETGLDLYLTGLGIVEQSGSTTATCQFAWDSDLGWESRKESIEHYGDCYVGGSGGDMFCNLLQNGEFVFTSHAPSLEKAIVLSLSHLTTLVGDQLRRGSGVKLLFGGGFEVATLLGNQIQKITNVTFHFWSATKNDQSELQVTFRFAIKVSYFEDYLVLRRFQIAGPGPTATVTDEVYIVRPVYRYVTKSEEERIRSEISIPEMTSRFNAYYVHFPDKHSGNKTYVGVHKSSSDLSKASLRYYDEGGGIMKIEIDNTVLSRIAAAYDNIETF